VADYVLSNADKVMISSLKDLAKACGVSEPTIIRFLNKLNYSSYQVFRVNIAQALSRGSNKNIYDEISPTDSVDNVKIKVIQKTVQSLQDSIYIIDSDQLAKLVNWILRAEKTFIIGVGASAEQAFDLHHKLQRLGLASYATNDSHMINIMCSNLNGKDLLVAFSHSGESREILDGLRFAQAQDCPVAVVTSFPNSSAAGLADCMLLSSSLETRYRSDSMTSRIIQLAIIDMVYVLLALKLGEQAQANINKTRLAVAINKT
jgi:DNA-binding MurR/RpiR family transcriptional regulator